MIVDRKKERTKERIVVKKKERKRERKKERRKKERKERKKYARTINSFDDFNTFYICNFIELNPFWRNGVYDASEMFTGVTSDNHSPGPGLGRLVS